MPGFADADYTSLRDAAEFYLSFRPGDRDAALQALMDYQGRLLAVRSRATFAGVVNEQAKGGDLDGEPVGIPKSDRLAELKLSDRKWYMVYCRAVENPEMANATVLTVYEWLSHNRDQWAESNSDRLIASTTFEKIVSNGKRVEGKSRPRRKGIPKGRSVASLDEI